MSTAVLQEPLPVPGSWTDADWTPVCPLDDIVPDTGVCALVGGRQIAIVRVGAGERLFAIDNFDPFSNAFVISRGIVGDRNGVPKIASPIYKQSFSLISGECLDDPSVALAIYPVRLNGGQVEVQGPPAPARLGP